MKAGDSTLGGGMLQEQMRESLYREDWALQIARSEVGKDIRKRQVP